MSILLAVTTHNEELHIGFQLDNALSMGCYDNIVILDDGSTDNTWNIISNYATNFKNIHIFRNDKNSVLSNGENRWVTISNIIRDSGFNPTWVNNRAADIVYPIKSGKILVEQIEYLTAKGAQTISISFVNLWRSDSYYRVDGWWNEGIIDERMKVLWKYDNNFVWSDYDLKAGMHQGASIPSIHRKLNMGISSGKSAFGLVPGLHYGMSSHAKMVSRFCWSMEKAIASSKINRSFDMPPPDRMPQVMYWGKFNGYKVFYEFNMRFEKLRNDWLLGNETFVKPKVESLYDTIKKYNSIRAEEYLELFRRHYGNS